MTDMRVVLSEENDRLIDENAALRAEVKRLVRSRNRWGQKYNKLLEKHKITLAQLKAAVWSDSEECRLLTADNALLREAVRLWRAAYQTGRNEPLAFAFDATNAALKESSDE